MMFECGSEELCERPFNDYGIKCERDGGIRYGKNYFMSVVENISLDSSGLLPITGNGILVHSNEFEVRKV